MTTVINPPQDSASGAGWALAIVLLVAVLGLGWFALTRMSLENEPAEAVNVNVSAPMLDQAQAE
jgi:hypothetical protein